MTLAFAKIENPSYEIANITIRFQTSWPQKAPYIIEHMTRTKEVTEFLKANADELKRGIELL